MAAFNTVAVTGASGFIGRSVCRALADAGHVVVPLTRAAGHDLARTESLASVGAFDALVHLAGRVFVPESYEAPAAYLAENTLMALNALELCRRNEAPILFASSYVYGAPARLPVDESHPVSHWNPYCTSKLLGEEVCRSYAQNFGVHARIMRIFNVFGPGQDERFLVAKVIAGLKAGALALGDPAPRRDYLHVEDTAMAFALGLRQPWSGVEVFNVGSGISFSVSDVVARVAAILGTGTDCVSYTHEPRRGEIGDVIANTNKIAHALNWTPQRSFEQGLQETVTAMEAA